jgi:hypothetical protein
MGLAKPQGFLPTQDYFIEISWVLFGALGLIKVTSESDL